MATQRKEWIVVADSSTAKVYDRRGRSMPNELVVLVNRYGHLRERELTSDRPGQIPDPKGYGAHVLDQQHTHKHSELLRFANTVADYLESGRLHNSYDQLTLVAPPEFLGLLRKALGASTKRMVSREVPKDLMNLSERDLKVYLKDTLQLD